MAAHSSILAWEIPWLEEPGGLQSMGSRRVKHEDVKCPHRGFPGGPVVKTVLPGWGRGFIPQLGTKTPHAV